MDQEERRKVKKYWGAKVALVVGVIGSLCLLPFAAVESFQTYKQDTVPQRIVDVEPELRSLLEIVTNSDKSIKERTKALKKFERVAKENKLGTTRISSWSVSHLLHLEQALLSGNHLSQSELKQLLKSLETSLWLSFRYSYSFHKNNLSQESSWILSLVLSQEDPLREYIQESLWELTRKLEREFDRDFMRDFELIFVREYIQESMREYVQILIRDWERYFERHFERELKGQYLREYLRKFEQEFEQEFEQRFLKQILLIKLYLLQLEQGQIPEITIEKLSQQITNELVKAYEIELLKSYNFQADKESFNADQKQVKLIQFASLASISTIGLIVSMLLLIRQQNQGVTWNMTGLCFMPEECVGELYAIYEGLQSEAKAIWTIRLIMLWNILVLLKSLYIQVAIEDLLSPGQNKRD